MSIFKLGMNRCTVSVLRRFFVLGNVHSSKSTHCWNCNEISSQIFCENCNCLQKPDSNHNYFQLLDVDENFDVNEVSLSKKFKNLQKVLHPDKFSNKTEAEQKVSEEYSSLVNKAYSTLVNPLSRGIYMLGLKGIELPEKTDLESTFLHEIMEKNEEVECAETPEEIIKLEEEHKKNLSELQDEFNNALKSNDNTVAINVLVKMKYYLSILEQIKKVIRTMKIVR